ncbi:antimicrobial peptide NK-lysin [Gasterosteus aculeatus]
METSSVLLVCILAACSVWAVHGRSFEVNIDDQKQVEVEISVNGKLPGLCWACEWALKKVKKAIGRNATAESVTTKLKSICRELGLLKPLCKRFVTKHLGELIEEFTTTDDVRTICVNTGACKPKEFADILFYQKEDESSSEMNVYR